MEIEIGQLIRTIRRLWFLPVVVGLVLGLVGFGAGQLQSASYVSTTQLLVTPQITGESVLSDAGGTTTYVTLVTSGPVLDRVILELGLDMSREDLAGMISASGVSGTNIIQIVVTADDPDLAADIANALARSMVSTATDLSIGELQNTLDGLRGQADTLRDRITVIDTRLETLDTDANADDSQVQAEITQLKREKLQISQTLADLESTMREISTSMSTMSIPVVVTDFAQPSERSQATSPLLLALLGGFLGALLGAAWILYAAMSDRLLRDVGQVVSLPVLEQVSRTALATESDSSPGVLAAKIAGLKSATAAQRVAIVSARANDLVQTLGDRLAGDLSSDFEDVIVANGSLDDSAAMRSVAGADAIVIVAMLDDSSIDDLSELDEYTRMVDSRVLGTVVIGK